MWLSKLEHFYCCIVWKKYSSNLFWKLQKLCFRIMVWSWTSPWKIVLISLIVIDGASVRCNQKTLNSAWYWLFKMPEVMIFDIFRFENLTKLQTKCFQCVKTFVFMKNAIVFDISAIFFLENKHRISILNNALDCKIKSEKTWCNSTRNEAIKAPD